MRSIQNIFGWLTILTTLFLFLATGCKKEDDLIRDTTFNLKVEDVLGVTGTVTFSEYNNGSTTIDIILNNAPSDTYPASLCQNSAVEGGAVVIALNSLGKTGESSTIISSMSYNQLIAYDGHIKVLKSSNPEVILAMGDIGGNVITTSKQMYTLNLVGIYGVAGTALFEKRVNENTLVTISLTGTITGESYPSSINLGSIASVGGGPIVRTLNNVNGTSGYGYTNIRKLDSGIAITYDNWLVYDGYLNVYQTAATIENVITQGDIGSN